MTATSDRSRCIYCGSTAQLTVDHVPPKGIFPEPRSSDLVTVPACRPCNKLYELDDEYFRMAMTISAETNPVAVDLWRAKVVKGTLKRSPKLKATLLDTLHQVGLETQAGILIGKIPAVSLEAPRIDRVARRIVTALHWVHYGAVPRPGVRMRVVSGSDLRYRELFDRLIALDLFQGRELHTIGGGVFRYAFARTAESADWEAWLLLFYSVAPLLLILHTDDEETADGSTR
jgi:hypothetical protein